MRIPCSFLCTTPVGGALQAHPGRSERGAGFQVSLGLNAAPRTKRGAQRGRRKEDLRAPPCGDLKTPHCDGASSHFQQIAGSKRRCSWMKRLSRLILYSGTDVVKASAGSNLSFPLSFHFLQPGRLVCTSLGSPPHYLVRHPSTSIHSGGW